ncbi:MAG: type transporter [Deferribacteraceae bacterium]|nr:type transporter [Deferribacteraceae bacterium]
MHGISGIFLREILVLKSRIWKVILSSSVSPLLFLLAFGFGIEKNSDIGGINYVHFLIPGLITMSSMNQAYGISTEINISRFYFKIFDEYLLAPVKRWQIIAGESLYGVVKGLIPVLIVYIYGVFLNVGMRPGFLFIISLIVHLLTFSLIGFIVALIVKNHGDQFSVNTFVMTPMIFLSGTFYPVEDMPAVIRYIAYFFPLTYSNRLIRSSLLGNGFSFYDFFLLFVMMVVLFFIAKKVIDKVETI